MNVTPLLPMLMSGLLRSQGVARLVGKEKLMQRKGLFKLAFWS
jgi:hypothetical protein